VQVPSIQADQGALPGEAPWPSRVTKAALGNSAPERSLRIRPSLSAICHALQALALAGRSPADDTRLLSASDRSLGQWGDGRLGKARQLWSRRRVSRLFPLLQAPHLLFEAVFGPRSRQRLHLRAVGALSPERISSPTDAPTRVASAWRTACVALKIPLLGGAIHLQGLVRSSSHAAAPSCSLRISSGGFAHQRRVQHSQSGEASVGSRIPRAQWCAGFSGQRTLNQPSAEGWP